MTGEELYANVCQGCHMSDAKGAAGAGTYPSLAGDSNLEVGFYPVSVVVNGQRGMPRLGAMLSDDQVAAVGNFLRAQFCNSFRRAVAPRERKAARRRQTWPRGGKKATTKPCFNPPLFSYPSC